MYLGVVEGVGVLGGATNAVLVEERVERSRGIAGAGGIVQTILLIRKM